ncbi:MAG: two-component system sensor histidine kinase NtrB [Desulfovibrio sp.]
MKSSLSNNQDSQTPTIQKTSLAKIFTIFLIILTVGQLVVGLAVIHIYVGNSMKKIQREAVQRDLEAISQTITLYADDRSALLSDYAKFSIVSSTVMNPSSHESSITIFLNSLQLMQNKSCFALLDFEGELIHATDSTTPLLNASGEFIQEMLAGKIDSYTTLTLNNDIPFWLFAVPVLFNGMPEGILAAYFPADLNVFTNKETLEHFLIELRKNNITLVKQGLAQEESIVLERALNFGELSLRVSISEHTINTQINTLIKGMITILVIGVISLVIIFAFMGKRLFIVPNEKLKILSRELEDVIEQRTNALKQKTQNLALEVEQRKKAELQLKEQEATLSVILDGLGAAFMIIDPNSGKITQFNTILPQLLGIPPEDLLNSECKSAFRNNSPEQIASLCRFDEGKTTYNELLLTLDDEKNLPISRHVLPVTIAGKIYYVIIVFDITERKKLERELSVAQKLESIGQLAAGIAHEINTPIQFVGDSILFIEEAYQDLEKLRVKTNLLKTAHSDDEFKEIIQDIEELEEDIDLQFVVDEMPKAFIRVNDGINRVATIVRAMKNFSHPGSAEKKLTSINEALKTTATVAKNEWKYAADLILELDDNLPQIQALPGDINQVFLNIIVNAAHAVAAAQENTNEKGTITIKTFQSGENTIQVNIKDTGIGIKQSYIDRIFDPLFTTKEVGKGTGQGLAIAYDIVVSKHQGHIAAHSQVGEGTEFVIQLPIVPDQEGKDVL